MAIAGITEGIVTRELLVRELRVVELVVVIVQGQGWHWCSSKRWKVQYLKAIWEQGVDAPAQVALKRDEWEEADYQT